MKMKFLFALLFLSATILLNAQEAKYGIKSAIIKKDVVAMGQNVECTWYMDDYGKKESTELTMKTGGVAGVEKHIRTIADGSSAINIDLDMKTAMKMKLPEKPINYLQLTPEIVENIRSKKQAKKILPENLVKSMVWKSRRWGRQFRCLSGSGRGLCLNPKLLLTEWSLWLKQRKR
ncbi:hypothetical protein [Parabacteroides goldsteinii]|uniref:hypothetical protein n=1 Tax=Parabacteroides goldsteinii TaxID=328812 RepID=UPI00321B091A